MTAHPFVEWRRAWREEGCSIGNRYIDQPVNLGAFGMPDHIRFKLQGCKAAIDLELTVFAAHTEIHLLKLADQFCGRGFRAHADADVTRIQLNLGRKWTCKTRIGGELAPVDLKRLDAGKLDKGGAR
ncbi:hypothetical protein D3C81_1620030 [compost metagenome]